MNVWNKSCGLKEIGSHILNKQLVTGYGKDLFYKTK